MATIERDVSERTIEALTEQLDALRADHDRLAAQVTASELTRRHLLAGLGGATAAGVALGTAGRAEAQSSRIVGAGREHQNSVQVIGTVTQTALDLTGFGFLTRISGLDDASLFRDAANRTEATSRFTFHATTKLASRSAAPGVFTTNGLGTIDIWFHPDTGSDFGNPASFATGNRIARHDARLQTVVALLSEGEGIVTMVGELRQQAAGTFTHAGRRRTFGRRGLRRRMLVTGPGRRTRVDPPESVLNIAGELLVTSER